MRDTFAELRTVFDGSDSFMTGGHQIIRPRGAAGERARPYAHRQRPAWTKSDEKIKALLLKSFPKLQTNVRQRKAAARWMRVIYLYHRTGFSKGQIAQELGESVGAVKMIIIRINRAAKGLTGPRGRPKKGVPIQTT